MGSKAKSTPKERPSGLLRSILGGNEKENLDQMSIRALLSALAAWGGKGKDEIVQVLCREIGVATAAILKEPLNQVIESRKLSITIELAPKESQHGSKIKTKVASRK